MFYDCTSIELVVPRSSISLSDESQEIPSFRDPSSDGFCGLVMEVGEVGTCLFWGIFLPRVSTRLHDVLNEL